MKKRLLALGMSIMICFSLIACGNSGASEEKKEVSAEDLSKVVELLQSAEDDISATAALQLEGWSKYADIVNYYFDDEAYTQASEVSIKKRAESAHNYRMSAKDTMEQAKELLGNKGEGDYYNAVKDYYKAVNKFLTLVSTFPEGYSKLTYANAVAEYKADIQEAYGEVEFTKE